MHIPLLREPEIQIDELPLGKKKIITQFTL